MKHPANLGAIGKIFSSTCVMIWGIRLLYIFSLIFFIWSLLVFFGSVRTTEVATLERLERQYDYKAEEIAKLESQGKGEEWAEKLLSSMNADLVEIERGKAEMRKLASLSQRNVTEPAARYYLFVSVFLFSAGSLLVREVRNR